MTTKPGVRASSTQRRQGGGLADFAGPRTALLLGALAVGILMIIVGLIIWIA